MRTVYTRALSGLNWTSDVLRVLLERSTSTYTPDPDHQDVADFTGGGGVEISVASYARQTLGGKAVAADDTKNQLEFDANDVAFGNLEAGQTVRGLLVYKQVGGDDTTPADDPLIFYDDGKVDIVLAADAAVSATQLWVQPLEATIPNGTAVDFGGGATGTLTAQANRGARSLAVTALGAGATAGDRSTNVATDSILPAALQNGPFTIQVHADGLLIATQRGEFVV